jgi:hypothetical protein
MKNRKAYYSRKAGKIIAEGKRKNKTIYLFSIPSILKMLNSSLFTEEKRAKIMANYQSLDIIKKKEPKQPETVPPINIIPTDENHDKLDDFDPDEHIKEIKEVKR